MSVEAIVTGEPRNALEGVVGIRRWYCKYFIYGVKKNKCKKMGLYPGGGGIISGILLYIIKDIVFFMRCLQKHSKLSCSKRTNIVGQPFYASPTCCREAQTAQHCWSKMLARFTPAIIHMRLFPHSMVANLYF